MPKVLTLKGYVFFFDSNEGHETAHIHVRACGCEAKFWLSDLSLADNGGFAEHQLNELRRHISVHRNRLLQAWSDHFGR